MTTHFLFNNPPTQADCDPSTPLLDVLRSEPDLTGNKQSCDHEGECGVCAVLLGGQPVRSCLLLLWRVAGCSVLTIDGLADAGKLHPLQSAFLKVGAGQCGNIEMGLEELNSANHQSPEEGHTLFLMKKRLIDTLLKEVVIDADRKIHTNFASKQS